MRPTVVVASLSIILLCILLLCHAAAAESGRHRMDEVRVVGREEDRELNVAFTADGCCRLTSVLSVDVSEIPMIVQPPRTTYAWWYVLMVLQNVLEKLQSRKLSTLKRRQSRLPTCEVGAWCSVKKGPHFGQLCDCQRGSRCNFFFLKCL